MTFDHTPFKRPNYNGIQLVYTGDSSRLSRSKCSLKLCPKCSTQRTSARWCPFQTSHSGRVEPNWIFFHDVVCYPWSCHPTLALYGRKSSLPASLVNEAFNDNMSDELLVQHEWNLTEARRFTSLHLCRATTLARRCFKRRVSVVLSSNFSDQLSSTWH